MPPTDISLVTPHDVHERIIASAQAHDRDDVAVIATDARGIVVYWNPGAEALYGWARDEAVGRNIIDLTPTHGTVDEALRVMEHLNRGHAWSGDFIVRHRDGRPIYAQVTDTPVLHEQTVIGVVGVSWRKRRDSIP